MIQKICAVVCLFTLLFGCSKKNGNPNYPDSGEGLTKFHLDLFAMIKAEDTDNATWLIKSLLIPNHRTWFKKVFGDSIGMKLDNDYSADLNAAEKDLADLYVQILNDRQTDIRVIKFDKAGDPSLTPLQKQALLAMKNPVPLYSVRFVKPGEKDGLHVWSFVHVDGSFRLAGKMKSFK